MDEETHIFILNKAWKNLDDTGFLVKEEIIQGMIDADNPHYKLLSHWYNPETKKGLHFFSNAKKKGIKAFNSALKEYKLGNFKKSSSLLGLAVHLLSDLAVPAHSKLMVHIFDCNDLENYLKQKVGRIKFKTPNLIRKKKIDDYFEDLAKFSNKMECEPHSWLIGIRYKLFGTKRKNLKPEILRKQAPLVLYMSISYVMGMIDLFIRKYR